ncbi:hypothetical protein DDZ13_14870 [Coraliomargarita sinensis]|uniref:Uncharacterized protein n=1 Tax=Coraliomargarita sinensis TaxID=2174842 RepID=A0A317ZGG7_9BACT|nr:hypothetical protein DDZ13_14870 [Coraliomargarita sinensis]
MGGEFFGHTYNESESETIEFEKGKIRRVYGHDYCGFEMLDPGASWIEFTDVGYRSLLFRVDRGFQEATPLVKKLKADGNRVSWEDGYYRYSLTIDEMGKETQNQTIEEQPIQPPRD